MIHGAGIRNRIFGLLGGPVPEKRPEDHFALSSFSQEGEDMILRRAFEGQSLGYYVDIGAHHPFRFSNTYLFYRAGWRGINVDATPGSMAEFQRHRPRDINLEAAIASEPKELRFHLFNEPALNTLDAELAQSRLASGYVLKEILPVKTRTLRDVLEEHLPAAQKIDFLTIDVENFDLDVLKSNDWDQFRPTYVLAEMLGSSASNIAGDEVGEFLARQNYELFAKTFATGIFRCRS